ncbi:MAG: hypothetical protein JNM02_04200 [Anaerolineales bacterium]|nr:hypothetical protein [Anaerolineales bacterium]
MPRLFRRRRALFFVFTAILVTVCRCSPDIFGSNASPIMFADGSRVGSCKFYTEYADTAEGGGMPASRSVWACTLTCPDNSQVKFDLYSQPPFSIPVDEKTAFLSQYCSAEAMVKAEPSPTATAAPTDTLTPAPEGAQEQPIIVQPPNLLIRQPLLSGDVTACYTTEGFINFTLFQPVLDINGKDVALSINGTQVKCSIPANNPSLYSCSLPAGTKFPAKIIVTVDGNEVNNFSFDGATCVKTEPSKESDPATQPPAATEPPTVDPNSNSNGNPYFP